jgi:hypothetical protein
MKPNPLPLLRALARAVKTDRQLPRNWHNPLLDLVELLLSDRDPAVSLQTVRVVIEMVAANRRLNREQTVSHG